MKPSYYAIYVVRQNGGLQWAGARKFRPQDRSVTLKKETFVVDIAKPLYRDKKGRFIYLFEQGQGQIMTVADSPGVSPKLVRAVFGQEIIAQLVSGLNKQVLPYENIIWAVMGALGGVGLGWILCSYIGG
jgi:hypothetical protein